MKLSRHIFPWASIACVRVCVCVSEGGSNAPKSNRRRSRVMVVFSQVKWADVMLEEEAVSGLGM